MLAGALDLVRGHLLRVVVARVVRQGLRRLQVGHGGVALPARLENALGLLGLVFGAQRVGPHLKGLRVRNHLLFEVVQLPLRVGCLSLHGAERAVVLVRRPDRHVVEAAVAHAAKLTLLKRSGLARHDSRVADVRLARVRSCLVGRRDALVIQMVLGESARFLLDCGRGLERLLGGHCVSVSRLLQLLRLLQVAELVVGDQQVASTAVVRACLEATRVAQLSLLSSKSNHWHQERQRCLLGILRKSAEEGRCLTFFFSLELRASWLRCGVC